MTEDTLRERVEAALERAKMFSPDAPQRDLVEAITEALEATSGEALAAGSRVTEPERDAGEGDDALTAPHIWIKYDRSTSQYVTGDESGEFARAFGWSEMIPYVRDLLTGPGTVLSGSLFDRTISARFVRPSSMRQPGL